MKTKKLFTIILFVLSFAMQAQQTIDAAGGTATGSGGTVTYSVGQVAYTTISSTSGTVNQGVQQPFEILTLSGEDYNNISLNMAVYPNPTTSFLTLKIEDLVMDNVSYTLYDLNGKLMQESAISNAETSIDMQSFASGIYIFIVMKGSQLVKSFKIIKN